MTAAVVVGTAAPVVVVNASVVVVSGRVVVLVVVEAGTVEDDDELGTAVVLEVPSCRFRRGSRAGCDEDDGQQCGQTRQRQDSHRH